MSSTTILHRILGCLVLIVFSQYVNAKCQDLKPILETLTRLEETVARYSSQNAVTCLVPFEKISKYLQRKPSEHLILNDNPETKFEDIAMDPYPVSQPQRRNQRKNRSDNANANANQNVNSNVNTNRYYRRALIGDPHLFDANQNANSNFNFNSNLNKNIFDSDEDEV